MTFFLATLYFQSVTELPESMAAPLTLLVMLPVIMTATGVLSILASATILVPSSWPSGVCGARSLASSSSSSGADTRHTDIMITTSSTFHGYHPHTQQR